jgi:hypothetical protein
MIFSNIRVGSERIDDYYRARLKTGKSRQTGRSRRETGLQGLHVNRPDDHRLANELELRVDTRETQQFRPLYDLSDSVRLRDKRKSSRDFSQGTRRLDS